MSERGFVDFVKDTAIGAVLEDISVIPSEGAAKVIASASLNRAKKKFG